MTSINAMKLDFHSGLCLCDEARYWNPEWMIFHTPEKIRSVVIDEITEEQGIVLFMGQTGTSSIGDEFIDQTEKAITALYRAEKKALGKVPARFRTVEELARVSFDVITRIKRRHVDDLLLGRFDFDAFDLLRGFSERDGKRCDIKDEKVIDQALSFVNFDGSPLDVRGIFGNSQVLAGYDPETGFRLFYMTERMPVCEEASEVFMAQGSGRDTCDLVYTNFANTRTIGERRGGIEPLDGLIALLKGLNNAFRLTAGVEGYPKIIYFNALDDDPARRTLEICDGRSKLAGEMVVAAMEGYLPWEAARSFVDRVVFQGEGVAAINAEMLKAAPDAAALERFLRGYAVRPPLG